jgi:hypothetical protein
MVLITALEPPLELQPTLDALDRFIEDESRPLEQADDNSRFFDHRREYARTDYERGGIPHADWEALMAEMCRRADAAGWLRWALPSTYGGHDATNIERAVLRDHLAAKGLGLHNDLQNESSVIGNLPTVLMMRDFGTEAEISEWMPGFPMAGLRSHGAEPRIRRYLPGDHGRRRRRRVGHQRRQALQLRAPPRHARHRLRPHLGRAGRSARHHGLPRAHVRRGVRGRVLLVDDEHADGPCRGLAA